MAAKKKGKNTFELSQMLKIPYFDGEAAQDYIDIKNGGHLDWSTDENKEKLAKLVGEIEAEVSGGVNILTMIKAAFKGKGEAEYSSAISKIVDSKLSNTLLTDYLARANEDKNIRKFQNMVIFPYPKSFTMYKMFSSYLTVVPKEQMPIDMEKLNQAMLGNRGYYELIADDGKEKNILRFNINAFRNGYNLADLSKMKLVFYGVPVGEIKLEKLGIDKEFEYTELNKGVSAEEVLGEEKVEMDNLCEIYDVVLAGVSYE